MVIVRTSDEEVAPGHNDSLLIETAPLLISTPASRVPQESEREQWAERIREFARLVEQLSLGLRRLTDESPIEETQHHISSNDTIILVMGSTGTGKSSFVSQATGHTQVGVGHDLESHTSRVSAFHRPLNDGSGGNLVLVDTPGFDDTNKPDSEILEVIVEWLAALYGKGIGLAGIVFLHRITDNRMSGSSIKNFEVLRKLCGKDAMRHLVLTTSMWDQVNQATAIQRETNLRGEYWTSALQDGASLARFSGTSESAQAIVNMFNHDTRFYLDIQRELIDQRIPLIKTGAGSFISASLLKIMEEHRENIEALEEEHRLAMERGDQAMAEVASQERQRLREMQAQIRMDQGRLEGLDVLELLRGLAGQAAQLVTSRGRDFRF